MARVKPLSPDAIRTGKAGPGPCASRRKGDGVQLAAPRHGRLFPFPAAMLGSLYDSKIKGKGNSNSNSLG